MGPVCPYYAGTGDRKCIYGCSTEPRCITNEWYVDEELAAREEAYRAEDESRAAAKAEAFAEWEASGADQPW